MRMSGKMTGLISRTEWFHALLCLICFCVSAVWMLHADAVFGMETEAVTEKEDAGMAGTVTEASPDASCTIFIYMCGSNLESKYGLASENIDELLEAEIPDQTNVIIETGGTSRWWSTEWIAEDRLQRYIIRDHRLELLEEMDNASMGSAPVFHDFLRWGQENYWSDRNILVMWDHGGSSADGVCYDENFGYDFLSRAELKEAFDQSGLPDRFDLICLDTCYMASLANASLFSAYGRYMTASQTIVPGPGMDYRILAEHAAGSALEELGEELCDTFITKSAETGREEEAQLAFFNLDATQELIDLVEQGGARLQMLYDKTGDSYGIFAGAQLARVPGSGSKANVIDMMTFVNTMSLLDWSHFKERVKSLLDELVLYQACGIYADTNGVSIYYPLNYNETQLQEYESTTPLRNYGKLLNEIYGDLPEVMITFKDPGSISPEGTFDMEMTEESRPYLRGVILRIWKESNVIPGTVSLLADNEVETYMTGFGRRLSDLQVSSHLDGEAYALDSHFLLLSVYPTARTQLYSAPVCVNGEDTVYSFVLAETLFKLRRGIIYTMLGTLFDENGLPSRAFGHLKSGDRIAVYEATDETGEDLALQDEFIIEDESIEPERIPLPEGIYRCQYLVTDIIGRTVGSDYCYYEISEEDGERKIELQKIQPYAER